MVIMLALIGGFWDWLVVLGITLLVFGNRLPSVMRSLGLSLGEFKKGLKEGSEAQQQASALPQGNVAQGNMVAHGNLAQQLTPQQMMPQQMMMSPPANLGAGAIPVPKQMP
jgi:sec-independent protein translocase protein TatA